jgi:hypothetical protein
MEQIWRYAVGCVLGLAVALIAYNVVDRGGDLDVQISPKTGLSFKSSQDQALTDLISAALRASEPAEDDEAAVRQDKLSARAELDNFLQGKGYVHVESQGLAKALREIDKDTPLAREIRKILYDLDGPFALPGTLREADGRFWDAFEDLHVGLREDPRGDSGFFAELYARLLDENSILGSFNNQISANVQLIQDGDEVPRIYVCSGSELRKGTFVTVRADVPRGGWIDTEMDQDVRRFPCSQAVSSHDFLSGEKIKLGANPKAFDLVFPREVPEMEPFWDARSGEAKVVVYPGQLAPRVLLSDAR